MAQKKIRVGRVVSDKAQKTVTVLIERSAPDPVFEKYVRQRKKFLAHDEKQECRIGDKVEIQECRPLSKRKCWRVTRIVEKKEDDSATNRT